ncbi:MAG TPA: SCP2 sterol-binding domain-containing protein [Euzebyales bacterium]|nr:SCP2 sterol-binding domain-containing protein [Euzebyales bacterium]
MPVFPSTEWMDAFCAQLVAHPRAGDAATRLRGVYRFVVDPSGPLVARHTYEIRLAAVDSGVRAERLRDIADSPRVVVRTDYSRWRQLLEGRLDVGPALLFGHLRISGDMAALVGSRTDIDVLVEALREVDTTWLDAIT